MDLGRLLAAGKSLAGGHERAGRYRVNKRTTLPKFISPRNPFTAPVQPESSPAATPSAVKDGGEKSVVASAGSDAKTARENWSPVSLGRLAASWFGEWGQKINPMPRIARQPGPARSGATCADKTPIQPELSLDNVRVMRNDLSDADFEVVAKRMPVASPQGPPTAVSPGRLESVRSAWDRLTTGFFGTRPM